MLPTLTVPKVLLTFLLTLVAGGALVTQAAAQSGPTVLVVEGPPRVTVGDPATFDVSELVTGRAVPGASLFAFASAGPSSRPRLASRPGAGRCWTARGFVNRPSITDRYDSAHQPTTMGRRLG